MVVPRDHLSVRREMSARQLSRLAKAKGLDPLLSGGLNADTEDSEEPEESEEDGHFSRGGVVSASVRA